MPDIILPGPAGRIEARYQRQKAAGAPMALVLHAHPQFGGSMNNPMVYELYHRFHKLGCTTVRFNFRGVGRSQGTFDNGAGELSDGLGRTDHPFTHEYRRTVPERTVPAQEQERSHEGAALPFV